MSLAMKQRAKFEGWLKFELSTSLIKGGATNVQLESPLSIGDHPNARSDLSFNYGGEEYFVELKTPNTNWRMPGVVIKTRPITKNIADILEDAFKLALDPGNGLVLFVMFPIPPRDRRWVVYLDRIAKDLQINLSEADHCSRMTIPIGMSNEADLIVCCFNTGGVHL
jgi:hypothetical protein